MRPQETKYLGCAVVRIRHLDLIPLQAQQITPFTIKSLFLQVLYRTRISFSSILVGVVYVSKSDRTFNSNAHHSKLNN